MAVCTTAATSSEISTASLPTHPNSPVPTDATNTTTSMRSQGALNRSLESVRVRANDLVDDLALLDEQEGRHGRDAQVGGHVGHLVDVELVEARLAELVRELDHVGRDGLARAAPRREAVEHYEAVVGLGLVEIRLAVVGASERVSCVWIEWNGISRWM